MELLFYVVITPEFLELLLYTLLRVLGYTLGFIAVKQLIKLSVIWKNEKSCGSKSELAVQVGVESKV